MATKGPSPSSGAHRMVIPLHENWKFKQANSSKSEYSPVAQFPTNVHLDLMHNGIIEDPFVGKNEDKVQWVGKESWVYKTTFVSPALDTFKRAVLAFDGLDTYATVELNGKQILRTENMFVPERVDVTELINYGESTNVLKILFQSAWEIGLKLRDQHPEHKWGCWNGHPSRCAVRKAQYHYGWDWGPTLMTCGPWRPINLELFTSRVSDLYFRTNVHDSLKHAEISVTVEVDGDGDDVVLQVRLDDKVKAETTARLDCRVAMATFHIQDPQLWYPAGYGAQPLYTIHATLLRNDTKLDSCTKRVGLRRAKLVQKSLTDTPGNSFFFEVNHIPIFCGGSNWIPADSFIPRISPQKYRDWLQLAVDGNQVMIRVWGGGIYEEQVFYDTCDELGLLVWQDFLFACGNYPAYEEFLKSVEREAIANVKRLRHHPSIVIWAGNNEDYPYAESEKLEYNPNDQDPSNWLKSTFPARYIYEKLLADVMQKFSPDTYYHFGSPWGGKSTADPLNGDIHQWNVWHGSQEKYQNFDKLSGRFVSEFGMEAFPILETIDSYLPQGSRDPDRYPQSSTVDFHNKAAGHERRLALYMVENLKYSFEPFQHYIHCTQVMQAECLATAYRLWRREWKGPGKEYCAGALLWQLNDCWPVTSWSIVDYYLRPKHAYYAVKRELAPITVGMKRIVGTEADDKSHSSVDVPRIEVWGSNLTMKKKTVKVVLEAFDIVTGQTLLSKTLFDCFMLEPNRSTEIAEYQIPTEMRESDEGIFRLVFAAHLIENGERIARSVNWPEPLKYVHLQSDIALDISVSKDRSMVRLVSEKPAKGVGVYCEGEGVVFEDNCVDLVPGESLYIGVRGLKEGYEKLLRADYLE